MIDAAAAEIEDIAPEDKMRIEVLAVRLDIYTDAEKWELSEAIAGQLVNMDPSTPGWWIAYAYSARETKGPEAAENILLRAVNIHQENAQIRYDLARYACLCAHIDEAKMLLVQAFSMDAEFRKLFLDEPDLQPIWDSIENI